MMGVAIGSEEESGLECFICLGFGVCLQAKFVCKSK